MRFSRRKLSLSVFKLFVFVFFSQSMHAFAEKLVFRGGFPLRALKLEILSLWLTEHCFFGVCACRCFYLYFFFFLAAAVRTQEQRTALSASKKQKTLNEFFSLAVSSLGISSFQFPASIETARKALFKMSTIYGYVANSLTHIFACLFIPSLGPCRFLLLTILLTSSLLFFSTIDCIFASEIQVVSIFPFFTAVLSEDFDFSS